MKKLSLVLMFIVLLIAIFAITALADNIAPEANLTTDSGHWHVVGNDSWAKNCIPYLVDGDYKTGIPSTCANIKWDNHHFKYDQVVQVERVVLHVNGSGIRGNIDSVSDINIATDYYVVLYDANGKEISSVCQNAKDKTELVFEYEKPMEVTYVKIAYWAGYSTDAAYLREVEIYSHTCEFNEFKEYVNEPTCIEEGTGIYACMCGKTNELLLPPTDNHIYDDIENVVYENNNYLAYGTKTLGCITCDRTVDDFALPVFKFLGYSLNASGTTICAGYIVNEKQVEEYNIGNKTTLSYGVVGAVSTESTIIDINGNVLNGIKGKASNVSGIVTPRFDVKISSNNWERLKDESIILCAYVIDRESIHYICHQEATTNTSPITYNTIKNNLMAQP